MTTATLVARMLSRYRGALLGGIGSAAAVAVTLDPASSLARSSVKFAIAFAIIGTFLTVLFTAVIELAEYVASRTTVLPRAIARRKLRGDVG